MNICDQDKRLTPFLLGDLPEPESAAMRQHLAQCPACQAARTELEPMLEALKQALAADAASAPRLDAARRQAVLAVENVPVAATPSVMPLRQFRRNRLSAAGRARPPDASHASPGRRIIRWAIRPRPWLVRSAATILVLAVLSAIIMPSFFCARSSACRSAAVSRLGKAQPEALCLEMQAGEAGVDDNGAAAAAPATPAPITRKLERAGAEADFQGRGALAGWNAHEVSRKAAAAGDVRAKADKDAEGWWREESAARSDRDGDGFETTAKALGGELAKMKQNAPAAPAAPAPVADAPVDGSVATDPFASVADQDKGQERALAEFTAGTKSRLTMKGLYAGRSAGGRAEAPGSGGGAPKYAIDREAKQQADATWTTEAWNRKQDFGTYGLAAGGTVAGVTEERDISTGRRGSLAKATSGPKDAQRNLELAAPAEAAPRASTPAPARLRAVQAQQAQQAMAQDEPALAQQAMEQAEPVLARQMEEQAKDEVAQAAKACEQSLPGAALPMKRRAANDKEARQSEASSVGAGVDRAQPRPTGAATAREKTIQHMKEIVLPEINFRNANMKDVAAFFADASREFDDPGKPVEKRGVNLVVKPAPAAPAAAAKSANTADPFASPATETESAGAETPITFKARFVSLYDALTIVSDVTGHKMRIGEDGNVVVIEPAAMADGELVTKADLTVKPTPPQSEPIPPPKPRAPAGFNPFVLTSDDRFSTFGIDVSTASYALTRQALQAGQLPDPESVRTEEIVNSFDYGDAAPDRTLFRVYLEGAPSTFGAPGLTLLRIGIKGKRLGREEQRAAVLTFLIDTSGSMSQPDRIGCARLALRLLLDQLAPVDRIQLVSFDNHARLVLGPTPASEKAKVLAAFDRLQCNGSTNLEEGMRQAYQQAARSFAPGAENRVIMISDGVANLGSDNARDILRQVENYKRQGITFSVFGVGRGTYDDAMLQDLANKGDGVYRFLDSEDEVRRAFVDDLAATLNTIATDVKIQVEWSAEIVKRFRQLGYESRRLAAEQFRDDRVTAGGVGSGQSVTALYELELAGHAKDKPLGTVHVRYRRTDTLAIEEIEQPITADVLAASLRAARPQFRLAVGAAAFAELLRGSPYVAGKRYEDVATLLRPVALEMTLDTRVKELLSMVDTAGGLAK